MPPSDERQIGKDLNDVVRAVAADTDWAGGFTILNSAGFEINEKSVARGGHLNPDVVTDARRRDANEAAGVAPYLVALYAAVSPKQRFEFIVPQKAVDLTQPAKSPRVEVNVGLYARTLADPTRCFETVGPKGEILRVVDYREMGLDPVSGKPTRPLRNIFILDQETYLTESKACRDKVNFPVAGRNVVPAPEAVPFDPSRVSHPALVLKPEDITKGVAGKSEQETRVEKPIITARGETVLFPPGGRYTVGRAISADDAGLEIRDGGPVYLSARAFQFEIVGGYQLESLRLLSDHNKLEVRVAEDRLVATLDQGRRELTPAELSQIASDPNLRLVVVCKDQVKYRFGTKSIGNSGREFSVTRIPPLG